MRTKRVQHKKHVPWSITTTWKDRENHTMTVAFIWVFIAAFVSIALTYIFSSLFRKKVNNLNHYSRWFTGKYVIWTGMSLLLLFLSACSGITSSNDNVSPTTTPLALTATPQPTATSHTPT